MVMRVGIAMRYFKVFATGFKTVPPGAAWYVLITFDLACTDPISPGLFVRWANQLKRLRSHDRQYNVYSGYPPPCRRIDHFPSCS